MFSPQRYTFWDKIRIIILFKNDKKEFYVNLTNQSKSEFQEALDESNLSETYSNDISSYFSLVLNNIEELYSVYQKSEIKDTLVNDMPAVLTTMSAKFQEVNIYLLLACIQGKECYYSVMTFTLQKNEKQYSDIMHQMVYSIVEI